MSGERLLREFPLNVQRKFELRASSDHVTAKYCPYCTKCNDSSDYHKLKISLPSTSGATDGKFQTYCYRCKTSTLGNQTTLFQVLELGLTVNGNGPSKHADLFSGHPSSSTPSISLAKADDDFAVDRASSFIRPEVAEFVLPDQTDVSKYPSALMKESWDTSDHPCVKFLVSRGLSRETCEFYKVGYGTFPFQDPKGGWQNYGCVTFPWLGRDGEFGPGATGQATGSEYKVLRTKLRGLASKSMQRLLPSGGARGFFGWHTIPADCDTVILTEGEIDAMSVYQATKRPTLSVPSGAHSFSSDLLPALKRFKRIILFYDNDQPGVEGSESAARKLGIARCALVRVTPEVLARAHTGHPRLMPSGKPPKDANDLLLLGYDLNVILDSARAMRHEQVLSFDDLKDDVRRELGDLDMKRGVSLRSLPSLSKIIGPHRRGELTIVTGPTGSGKTTLLSQISMDYCLQGIPVLWGSFEIKNTRLIAMMMKQLAYCGGQNWNGTPPPDDQFAGALSAVKSPINFANEEIFNKHADEFDSLDLYFLRFFGSTDINKVMDALAHAVAQYDVQCIVLDNLQFMISGHGNSANGNLNKFEAQDRALDFFRAFATEHNVHIMLVLHPRKEPVGMPLSIESISGTAKASQEADNILIIQRDKDGSKVVEVQKNRFSGDLGAVSLGFNRVAKTFRDLLAHGDA